MVQNRKKLIDLFIGNISNSIVHKILEKATDNKDLADKYNKELLNSLNIAKRYRNKINPVNAHFPNKDTEYIRNRIANKIKAELLLRISKGYKNIDLSLVEELVDAALKDTNVI